VRVFGEPDTAIRKTTKLKRMGKQGLKNRTIGRYDQSWVVFDHDARPAALQYIQQAKGREHGHNVVFSNRCFEVWLLLHFIPEPAACADAQGYKGKVPNYIPGYDEKMPEINEILKNKEEDAILNAEQLRSGNQAMHNPYTDFDQLLKALDNIHMAK
jgi:hypothetical protein